MTDFELRIAISLFVGMPVSAGLLLLVFEILASRRKGLRYASKNIRLSLSAVAPNTLAYVVLAPWWALIYQQIAAWSSWQLPVSFAVIAASLVACDLSYYIEHWCSHKIRFFWRTHHGTHHNSEAYNMPLAYRVSFVSQVFTPLFYFPWLLLGFHPLVIVGCQMFVFHYQAWIHTEHIGQLGLLDRLINTPANHRMHHSRDPAHKAVNLGAISMLWDHLFSTYCRPREQVSYGVCGHSPTTTYKGIYRDPWRQTSSPVTAVTYADTPLREGAALTAGSAQRSG